MTVNGPVSVLDFHAQHAVEINGVKFIPLEAARQEIERLQTALRAAHAAGRAEGEREQDIYRAALAVVISDLGGEVTVSARTLEEAPELAETEWTTTDESFTEGQDVTFRVVVK